MPVVVQPGSSRLTVQEPPVLEEQLTAETAVAAPLLPASQSVKLGFFPFGMHRKNLTNLEIVRQNCSNDFGSFIVCINLLYSVLWSWNNKLAYSLTTATQLNLFSAVFYLPHLGVFRFISVLSISLMPANAIIYLERNICSFRCVCALHKQKQKKERDFFVYLQNVE